MKGSAWFSRLRKISSFMIPRCQSLFEGSNSRLIRFSNSMGANLEFCVVTW